MGSRRGDFNLAIEPDNTIVQEILCNSPSNECIFLDVVSEEK